MNFKQASLKQIFVYGTIGLIVVAAGTATGVLLAYRFMTAASGTLQRGELISSVIRAKERFPCVEVRQPSGGAERLCCSDGEKEKIVVFLSGNCGACSELLNSLFFDPSIQSKSVEVFLLVQEGEVITYDQQSIIYEISLSELRRLDVRLFPTLVKVGSGGIVTAISGNLSSNALRQFIQTGG